MAMMMKVSWMDHNLLGLGILSFQKVHVKINQLFANNYCFSPDSPIQFPLLFTEDPGFNLTVYLGVHEANACLGNDKLCGRIVFEPDDAHLQGNDDGDDDESDID